MFGRRTTSATDTATVEPQLAGAGAGGNGSADDAGEEIQPLWAPAKASARKSVEALLLERGQINEAHLVQARQVMAQTPGKTLAQILLSMNAASEGQILSALAETLSL